MVHAELATKENEMTTNTFIAPTGSLTVVCKSGNIYTANGSGYIFNAETRDFSDLIGAGCYQSAQNTSAQIITSGSSYSVPVGATFVGVNKTVGSATAIVLDAAKMPVGKPVTVVDQKGDANTNNITVTELGGALINGAASFVIDQDKMAASFIYDGEKISVA